MRCGTPCARMTGSAGSSRRCIKRRDLVERAQRKHGAEARVDALRRAPPDRARDRGPSIRRPPNAGAVRAPRNETSGRPVASTHLERAQDALPVAGVEARGSLGIARRKFVVKLGRRRDPRPCSEPPPARLRARAGCPTGPRSARGNKAPCRQRRSPAPSPMSARASPAAQRPPSGRKIHRAVDRAEQAMGREPLLVRRRPRGQDSQVPVDLHRVGVDDRRPKRSAQRERRRRLAARRWACDEERPPQVFGSLVWKRSCRPFSSPRSSPILRRRRSAKQHSTAPRKP